MLSLWGPDSQNNNHFHLNKTGNDADASGHPCVQITCFWDSGPKGVARYFRGEYIWALPTRCSEAFLSPIKAPYSILMIHCFVQCIVALMRGTSSFPFISMLVPWNGPFPRINREAIDSQSTRVPRRNSNKAFDRWGRWSVESVSLYLTLSNVQDSCVNRNTWKRYVLFKADS